MVGRKRGKRTMPQHEARREDIIFKGKNAMEFICISGIGGGAFIGAATMKVLILQGRTEESTPLWGVSSERGIAQ
jgi:hypothetical protein